MATLRCCILGRKLFDSSSKVYSKLIVSRQIGGNTDDRVNILRELLKRKKAMGPEKLTHRSSFLEWNYKAELYAFANRIGEKFSEDCLERAFTQRSYVILEEEKQKELGISDPRGSLADNQDLAENGIQLMELFIPSYLRTALPKFPEEGIRAVCSHLLSEENLARIVPSIGAEELILCSDFPVEKKTLASTMCSLVGALEESSGEERALLFVRDFVISTLSGQEINNIWAPENSFDVLSEILSRDGKNTPEARLIIQTGINTIMPCFQVGIYCDKKLIGSGSGETVDIAREQASLDALWHLWGTTDGKMQFPFRLDVYAVMKNNSVNMSVSNWNSEKAGVKS